MKYTTPQVLSVKKASVAIMGMKHHVSNDIQGNGSTVSAYQSDE
jgi:hypothetical protein